MEEILNLDVFKPVKDVWTIKSTSVILRKYQIMLQ